MDILKKCAGLALMTVCVGWQVASENENKVNKPATDNEVAVNEAESAQPSASTSRKESSSARNQNPKLKPLVLQRSIRADSNIDLPQDI